MASQATTIQECRESIRAVCCATRALPALRLFPFALTSLWRLFSFLFFFPPLQLTEQNQLLISQNQTLRLGGSVTVEDLAAAMRMSSKECVGVDVGR